MIAPGQTYLVMGLLDPDSLAYAVGRTLMRLGGNVIFTVQSEVLKRRYLDPSPKLSAGEKASLRVVFCDASVDDEVKQAIAQAGPLAGVVHSIAYANPKTCLGTELHTDAIADIQRSYHVSCVSLATVARHAAPAMKAGGAIVTLTFDSSRAFARYNWMGVHKAALEALVRALARRHGRDGIRVNAVSAGPLATSAAARIPGFDRILEIWKACSPLPWDPVGDKQSVADAVAFLLSPLAAKITGQVLAVDGGASAVGGPILDDER